MFAELFAALTSRPTIVRQNNQWVAHDPQTGKVLCAADSKQELLEAWQSTKQVKPACQKARK